MVNKTFSTKQLRLISSLKKEGYELQPVDKESGIPKFTKGGTSIKIIPKTKRNA